MAAMQNTAIAMHWDVYALLRHLSLVQVNPPGAGLVTHKRTARVHDERSRPQHYYASQC